MLFKRYKRHFTSSKEEFKLTKNTISDTQLCFTTAHRTNKIKTAI
ncbi:hypothetical protein BC792_10677 [Sphingobacterium allocomposti]|uniref:Uncharacterized protein n=1 Tax=Sphingobacterium allocomposti TaxID=415956 RepID=A0A5S5DNU7_9SPHI|nr:hypothetical protein BC792_10677 [Sphingobacterium composti Yoo et al. 2007 non Ten et al. 2007]